MSRLPPEVRSQLAESGRLRRGRAGTVLGCLVLLGIGAVAAWPHVKVLLRNDAVTARMIYCGGALNHTVGPPLQDFIVTDELHNRTGKVRTVVVKDTSGRILTDVSSQNADARMTFQPNETVTVQYRMTGTFSSKCKDFTVRAYVVKS
ncbi:hypothetical protein [Actinomadura rupiterrae]|uniref:hypothetical protein n=1 Tax=Actinomadura rupiterrae TaxID=559627 RepID=UPI0020A341CB|nr:hypothetical protein [Actinomadura rupiterrae]MCP2336363.1 hypothetical protein [Actinomadura rupiterrae]